MGEVVNRCGSGFQSTPPAWGATQVELGLRVPLAFQSTPPAWGATSARNSFSAKPFCFNPRPPRGGRLQEVAVEFKGDLFQSTPPAWGATSFTTSQMDALFVSIHAPRVGGDLVVQPCITN